MAEKSFKSRIVHKHDTAENWEKATGFIPMQGEIIIYDIDASYDYERIKIGDGATIVDELPFANDALKEEFTAITNDEIDEICGAQSFGYDEDGNVSILSLFEDSNISYDNDGNVVIS